MSAININKNNFQSEVLNYDKKVLLDFWAPRCGHCRMVVPMVEKTVNQVMGARPKEAILGML